MRGNPFLEEGVRTYFAHRGILRTYLFIPCGLSVVLITVWPRGSLESILRSGTFTDAFAVVALAFFALLLYLGARYGSEDFSPENLSQLREYVTMTPVTLLSVVLGKAGFFILHTLFLLLLGAPILLAPIAVDGLTLPKALAALAVLGTAGLAARMFGLLVLAAVGARPLLKNLVLMPGILLVVIVSLVAVPSLSSIRALLGLSSSPGLGAGSLGAPLSPAAACSLVNLGAALVCAAALYLVLGASRRRARAGRQSNG